MKIKTIIEFTPIQIRNLIEEHLRKESITVKSVKFSKSGVIVYVVEPSKISQVNSKEEEEERSYPNKKMCDLAVDERVINCLRAVDVNTFYQLENFVKKQIVEYPGRRVRGAFYIRNFGEKSYKNLMDVLKENGLQIKEDGTFVRLS